MKDFANRFILIHTTVYVFSFFIIPLKWIYIFETFRFSSLNGNANKAFL